MSNLSNGSIAGRPVRVGWLVEPGFGPVDREVAAAVADLLRDAGCDVEAVRIPVTIAPSRIVRVNDVQGYHGFGGYCSPDAWLVT
jgi:hypothetical protein